jgi:ATP-dependent RNA helicase DeaD
MSETIFAPPTFDALALSADVRKAVDALGYVTPTPVQLAVFDPATRGKNLVVQARTGTGKTAAFGLPIVDQIVRRQVPKVQALILTPTRELALQVAREIEQLAQFRGTKVVAIYGGAAMGRQIDALADGAQVVAGTPGRVLDHLRRGTLDPEHIRVFVLDEADEMLSMGFQKELNAICDTLPKDRQGLFFSATIPPDIERMAHAKLKDPEFVTLSSDQVGALEVNHFVYMLRGGDKRQELVRILEVEDPESAIIFSNTRDECVRVAEALQNKGFDADWLNGDLEQRERERVMGKTKEGQLRFLVATDVAARGIDISHLTHVINYDFPEAAEGYVHRTGRTGRAGRTGTAISIVTPKDIGNLYILRLTYKIRPLERELPTAGELKTRAEHDIVALFADAFGSHSDEGDLALARRLLTHANAEAIVAGLMRDHLGARAATSGDPAAEAAEARRARNPAPIVAENEEPVRPSGGYPPNPQASGQAPNPRGERAGRRGRRAEQRLPHSSYATWEPRPEADDDEAILSATTAETPVAFRHDTEAPTPFSREEDEVDFVQIYVNVGRRDGARPGDFQRLLVQAIPPEDTGKIRVRDRNTFVSVRKESLERAIAALAGQTIGGRSVLAEPARLRTTS